MSRVILIGTILFLMAMAKMAFAHGDAKWIEIEPSYKNIIWGTGEHCCGANDCHKWSAADIEVRPDGYFVKSQNFLVPHDKVHFTKPEQLEVSEFWACIYPDSPFLDAPKRKQVRCLFVPGGGA